MLDKSFTDSNWTDNKNNEIKFLQNTAIVTGNIWGENDGKNYIAESNTSGVILRDKNNLAIGYELILDSFGRLLVNNNLLNIFERKFHN